MFISRLKRRAPTRFYARLDNMNRCETLWATASPPEAGRWVEVTELNPYWIGKPLPPSARRDAPTGAMAPALTC